MISQHTCWKKSTKEKNIQKSKGHQLLLHSRQGDASEKVTEAKEEMYEMNFVTQQKKGYETQALSTSMTMPTFDYTTQLDNKMYTTASTCMRVHMDTAQTTRAQM
eukprot:4160969-Amphidinium_carterae.5